MTSTQEISGWFDGGVKKGATHLVVACDTFDHTDHTDYPVYVMPFDDVVQVSTKLGLMQRVMEVYDLRKDKKPQLDEDRAFNF